MRMTKNELNAFLSKPFTTAEFLSLPDLPSSDSESEDDWITVNIKHIDQLHEEYSWVRGILLITSAIACFLSLVYCLWFQRSINLSFKDLKSDALKLYNVFCKNILFN